MPIKTGVPAVALAVLLGLGGVACQGSNHYAEGNDGGAGAGVTNSGNDTAVTTKPNDALGGADQVPATQPSNVAAPRTDSAATATVPAGEGTPGGALPPSTPTAAGTQAPGAPVTVNQPHPPAP
jgi:hypothetical protein